MTKFDRLKQLREALWVAYHDLKAHLRRIGGGTNEQQLALVELEGTYHGVDWRIREMGRPT